VPEEFHLWCGADKTARVWLQGDGGSIKRVRLWSCSRFEILVAYITPLRCALIDANMGHANLVVCESDYAALGRGIEHLPPAPQEVATYSPRRGLREPG
jgi:hypothetical protein